MKRTFSLAVCLTALVIAAPQQLLPGEPDAAQLLIRIEKQIRSSTPAQIDPFIIVENPYHHQTTVLRNLQVVLVDSSKNGWGLSQPATRPLAVSASGWLLAYRQWAGPLGTSGQLGAAYSATGETWTTIPNLNGGLGSARYPSALGVDMTPYIFWNESIEGGLLYTYAADGWLGQSFAEPGYLISEQDVWVPSPTWSYNDDSATYNYNIAISNWTTSNIYLHHAENWEIGPLEFGNTVLIIDVINDLEGGGNGVQYHSDATLDINIDGIGYVALSGYFDGALSDPPETPYASTHTMIFRQTVDHGVTWQGDQDGSGYFYIPDAVFEHMMSSGEFPASYMDECLDEPLEFEKLFCSYKFDLRVDAAGNPHFVIGVMAFNDGSVYPSIPNNGFYHFWIDRQYLTDPGPPQSATGWNYSRVIDAAPFWSWEDDSGNSYWHMVFPSLTVGEGGSVFWVAISGPSAGAGVVIDNGGTPGLPCDDEYSYPTWNEEVFIVKSVDAGASWWNPLNATNTAQDCWIDEEFQMVCSESALCPDALTLDIPNESGAHVAAGATDDRLPLVYQRSVRCDPAGAPDFEYDHRQRIYAGWVELTEEPPGECPCDVGDLNCDGAVDILDIVRIINIILEFEDEYELCVADVNGDGRVDILDIMAMLPPIIFP